MTPKGLKHVVSTWISIITNEVIQVSCARHKTSLIPIIHTRNGMEYQKVKVIASQARFIYQYKNLRLKLMNCNANIYFNKQCLVHKVTPTYAKIRVPYTSPASIVTQRKASTIRIKDEIRFLYQKKEHLNRDLYDAHLQKKCCARHKTSLIPIIHTRNGMEYQKVIIMQYETLF